MPVINPLAVSAVAEWTKPSEITKESRERLPGIEATTPVCSVARSVEYREQQTCGSEGIGPSTYNREPSAPTDTPLSPTLPSANLKWIRPSVYSNTGSIHTQPSACACRS